MSSNPQISVLILTYNAPKYVRETIETLNEVTQKSDRDKMEILVWDNASGNETKCVLEEMLHKKYIDRVEYSQQNLLFAGGNNACAKLASPSSKLFLLLNSDIRINKPDWFSLLLTAKEKGNYAIAAYGAVNYPPRADGYCYLIDRDLYEDNPLDENFQWFFGITLQEAEILKSGRNILAFFNHDNLLYHYGGKSGNAFVGAKGMDVDYQYILDAYKNAKGSVDFRLSPGNSKLFYVLKTILKRLKSSIASKVKT